MDQWFLYDDKNYRGPYSTDQLTAAVEFGSVHRYHLVWKEGMADWAPVKKVEELQDAVAHAPTAKQAPRRTAIKSKTLLIAAALSGAFALTAAVKYFTRAPLASITDLSAPELRTLQAAVDASEPTAAVALIPGAEPRFYVAGNLEQVEVRVVGVTETLVDAFHADARFTAKLDRGLFRSVPIRHVNGFPLPRGEYLVSLTKDDRLVGQRAIFLGGANDSEYARRLADYHAVLKNQVAAELDETRELTQTLEKQFRASNVAFAKKKNWADFHARWIATQKQFDSLFEEWTSSSLPKEFYYGTIYSSLKEAGVAIGKVHTVQHAILAGDTAAAATLASRRDVAETALRSVRARIELAERQPSTRTGLPKRITY